jgi:hypothetical protein
MWSSVAIPVNTMAGWAARRAGAGGRRACFPGGRRVGSAQQQLQPAMFGCIVQAWWRAPLPAPHRRTRRRRREAPAGRRWRAAVRADRRPRWSGRPTELLHPLHHTDIARRPAGGCRLVPQSDAYREGAVQFDPSPVLRTQPVSAPRHRQAGVARVLRKIRAAGHGSRPEPAQTGERRRRPSAAWPRASPPTAIAWRAHPRPAPARGARQRVLSRTGRVPHDRLERADHFRAA